jgi:hypothetical protein
MIVAGSVCALVALASFFVGWNSFSHARIREHHVELLLLSVAFIAFNNGRAALEQVRTGRVVSVSNPDRESYIRGRSDANGNSRDVSRTPKTALAHRFARHIPTFHRIDESSAPITL